VGTRTRVALAAFIVLGGLLTGSASAATVASPCHADDVVISKAGREAAAGNRYLDLRITNVSAQRCRLTGFPAFTWRRNGGDIGWSSTPEPGQAVRTVVVRPGRAAFTTLHWVDPGPVPAGRCNARRATAVRMTLPHRPHVYRIAVRAKVCTTEEYRPSAFPVRGTIDVA